MIYLKKFETTSEYNTYINGSNKILPNVSLTVDDSVVHYNPYVEQPFFCKLTLNDSSVVEIEGSGELTNDMISDYDYTCVSAEIDTLCTSIGDGTFQRFYYLSSVTITDNVTSIGYSAFEYCCLTSVTIPNSVTSIGENAFQNCPSLTSVTIPDSVTSIGMQAFRLCLELSSITVEATAPPTLGSYAFESTNNAPIYVPSGSVDTYKAATNWNAYADRIQAIPTT